MKKLSALILHERGIVLPYVVIICLMVMMNILFAVTLYYQEMDMTKSHLEQLNLDTMLQRAYTLFRKEYPVFTVPHGQVDYPFVEGDVTITYTLLDDHRMNVYVLVETEQAVYSTRKIIEPVLLFE